MRASSEQRNPNEAAPTPFFVRFLATGFYSGYSPIAPGTAGTLAGLAVYLIPSFEQPLTHGIAIALGFFFGLYAGSKIEKEIGHDPTIVVIDEMVGMWIALFLLPKTFLVVLAAFALFRVLDVIKPQPARVFQAKGGGLAIMMDDVVAGVYTNLLLLLGISLIRLL